MWNPTTSTTSSSSQSSSDNKPLTKEVEVDDCKCSGSSSVGEQQLIDQQLQQQIGRNNSKHQQQTSPFGGQLTTNQQHKQQQQKGEISSAIEAGAGDNLSSLSQDLEGDEGDNKKFLESTEEYTDSGFISGPQTSSSSNIFPDTNTTTAASSGFGLSSKQLNITGTADQQQQKQQQYDIPNLDSGCIEVEEDFSDIEQQQQQQQQPTKDTQMLLKNNVDAGMSEWFCNLSLQNNPSGGSNVAATTSQRSQQSMSVANSGLNNLDAPKTRPTQQQQHASNRPSPLPTSVSLPTTYAPHAAGSSASNMAQQTLTGNIPKQITPANAWEHYYQQNDDGDTPLHLACISGYVDVVAALIRMSPHPCLFNIQNDEAQTPLHLATLTAQPKIIRMLLIAGAEPTVRDRHGNTALHLACISGEEQCVRALTIPISASEVHEAHRQYGHRANDKSYLKYAHLPSDLEIRNYDGERCVHLAAQAGYIDILRILVLYGADINAREGKSGRTPLHIAIECCNEDLANFLLDECQKLNLETATYAGLTAYQVACALNKSEMQDILEKRGAEPLTPPDSDYDSSDIETDLDDSKYHRFGDPGYFLGYKGGNVMTVA